MPDTDDPTGPAVPPPARPPPAAPPPGTNEPDVAASDPTVPGASEPDATRTRGWRRPGPPREPRPRKRLAFRRSGTDRYLGGVAGGVAALVDLDPVLVRVAMAVAAIVSPVAVVAYVGAWVLVPEEGDDRSLLGSAGRPGGLRALGAALAIGLGALVVLPDLRPGGSGTLQFGVVLIVAGVVLLSRPTSGSQGAGPGGRQGPGRDEATAPATHPINPVAPPGRASAASSIMDWRPGSSFPGRTAQSTRTSRPRPPKPRWFLGPLVLSALVVVVGIVLALDQGGAVVSPGTVLSLGLVVVGAGLLVSVFWGRARGLILVGVALLPLWSAFSPSDVPRFPGAGDRRFAPSSPDEVAGGYALGFGALEVDLTELGGDLTSMTTSIGLTAGRATVVVPAEAEVVVRGRMGMGDVELWDDPQRRGYRTRDSGLLANRRIAGTFAPFEATCYLLLDSGSRQVVDHDDFVAGDWFVGDEATTTTTSSTTTSSTSTTTTPPAEPPDPTTPGDPPAGGEPTPPSAGATAPPAVGDAPSAPPSEAMPTTTTTPQPPVLVDDHGAPCVPRPPDPDPPTVTLDITIGAGRLEVHRVPTPA